MVDYSDDKEVLATYVLETRERLNDIEVSLLRLPERKSSYDELVHRMFRDAHSIKSGGNLLKLKNIECMAHGLEDLLHIFRTYKIIPDDKAVSILLEAIDSIRELLDHVKQSNRKNIVPQLKKLHDLQAELAAGLAH